MTCQAVSFFFVLMRDKNLKTLKNPNFCSINASYLAYQSFFSFFLLHQISKIDKKICQVFFVNLFVVEHANNAAFFKSARAVYRQCLTLVAAY